MTYDYRKKLDFTKNSTEKENHETVHETVNDIAKKLIYGDRAADYGTPSENFSNIAKGWSVIVGKEITAEQVCLCMAWLKTCRLVHQPEHTDSIVDAAGYFGCYERVNKNI